MWDKVEATAAAEAGKVSEDRVGAAEEAGDGARFGLALRGSRGRGVFRGYPKAQDQSST